LWRLPSSALINLLQQLHFLILPGFVVLVVPFLRLAMAMNSMDLETTHQQLKQQPRRASETQATAAAAAAASTRDNLQSFTGNANQAQKRNRQKAGV
jgi:type III secretory pathway component EscV